MQRSRERRKGHVEDDLKTPGVDNLLFVLSNELSIDYSPL
jgi:hypothetical protein